MTTHVILKEILDPSQSNIADGFWHMRDLNFMLQKRRFICVKDFPSYSKYRVDIFRL